MKRFNTLEKTIALLFLVIPTILIIVGLQFFPARSPSDPIPLILGVPLAGSLILLSAGFLLNKYDIAKKIKILGWILIAFFWSTQPNTLYYNEGGDFVNAFLCIAGVYVLFYVAYHEWLSIKSKKEIGCLNWIAGATAISGIIYYGVELTPLEMWLREVVAAQSAALLNLFTGNVSQSGILIEWEKAHIAIIFSCTAVQSMVIFVGMILPLKKVSVKRKIIGLLVTVVPIYFLNLVRNALVVYLVGIYSHDFFGTAHNIIGKGGSLLALILLLFIVIKVVPEVFDEIMCLTDLYKRDGPIENFLRKSGRKK
jgi:archaeosortase A (PGF-CTERM-specific)